MAVNITVITGTREHVNMRKSNTFSISKSISNNESTSNLRSKMIVFSNLKNKICVFLNLKNEKWVNPTFP